VLNRAGLFLGLAGAEPLATVVQHLLSLVIYFVTANASVF
jgi:hypothetical protein